MKIYSKVTATLTVVLLLLLVVQSCTVTKRVHRKGWHVEWKSRLKSADSEHSEKKLEAQSFETPQESKELQKNKQTLESSENHEAKTLNVPEEIQSTLDENSEAIPFDQVEHNASSVDSYQTEFPESTKEDEAATESKQQIPSKQDFDFAFSLIFFILAIICAGLGMLLLLWIQAISSSALIIILGIFMFAFWLFGLAALIGSIALLISGMLY